MGITAVKPYWVNEEYQSNYKSRGKIYRQTQKEEELKRKNKSKKAIEIISIAPVLKNTSISAETPVNQVVTEKEPSQVKNAEELKMSGILSHLLRGSREVNTPSGRIDVLTDTAVIEVKTASNWKHGIGQVLVYSFYYPSKKPTLFLFGENLDDYRSIAKEHCIRLGIDYMDTDSKIFNGGK